VYGDPESYKLDVHLIPDEDKMLAIDKWIVNVYPDGRFSAVSYSGCGGVFRNDSIFLNAQLTGGRGGGTFCKLSGKRK
jgi:hypothetical protein